MAILQSGDGTGNLQTVEATWKTGRVVLYPPEQLGSYFFGTGTGIVVTPAAGAEIFQFRNPSTTLCIIERVVVSMSNAAAVTAAQEFGWVMQVYNAWTVQGSGGTANTPQKKRQTMASSVVTSGDLRTATTGALTGGTKTPLGPFASGPGPSSNAIGSAGPIMEVECVVGRYPLLVLGQNEGFTIANQVAYATGSARFHVHVQWREATTF
jgi:hypothetical protein